MATNTDHWVDPYALASVYLVGMGAKDNAENRRVMVAWMLAESPSKTVNGKKLVNARGWNALNWTTPAISKRATGSWTGLYGHVFSTYDSPQAAAADLNDLLSQNDSRGFSAIKSSFVSGGDSVAAINNSAWVNGVGKLSYISGTTNRLLSLYHDLGGNTDTGATATALGTLASSEQTTAAAILGIDPNTILTVDMIPTLAKKISDATGEKYDDMLTMFVDFVGHKAGDVPVYLNVPGKTPTGTQSSPDPVSAVTGGVEGAINNIAQTIAPALSIVLGVVLMLGGLYILYKASSNEGSSISAPAPFSIVKAAA